MKKSNQIQIITTGKILSEKERSNYRVLLKSVLEQKGIISLCLDAKELFVEYNPEIWNNEKIYAVLEEAGFPVAYEIKEASKILNLRKENYYVRIYWHILGNNLMLAG